ncbi:MAG: chromophore lyase CpcT/CpeT [Rhodospirillaceae bacterium]
MNHNRITATVFTLAVIALTPLWAVSALAQGQDGTPAERDLTIIAEMLPGTYDNREQQYFDGRLGVREEARHERLTSTFMRVDLPAFGEYVFFVRDHRDNDSDNPYRLRLYSLSADNAEAAVRMKIYYLEGEDMIATYKDAHLEPDLLQDRTPENTMILPGCDVFWRREAGQFHGAMKEGECRWDWPGKGMAITDYHMMLAENALWLRDGTYLEDGTQITGNPDKVYHKLNRARNFTCYADMPGVSGGADIPFTRYGDLKITDQGGMARFTSNEDTPRTIEINLRNVDWPMNNEVGAYTRDSLVMYIFERNTDGTPGAFFGYTFTQPDAERLGLNLGFILVNCHMLSNRDAAPEF